MRISKRVRRHIGEQLALARTMIIEDGGDPLDEWDQGYIAALEDVRCTMLRHPMTDHRKDGQQA